MSRLTSRPKPKWYLDLMDNDRVKGVSWDDNGIRAVTAHLKCGHAVEYSSEHGGFDEPPYAMPSMTYLGEVTLRRVNWHDAKECERHEARLRNNPFDPGPPPKDVRT